MVMWRRMGEAIGWLVGGLMGIVGVCCLIGAPLYLFYVWVSFEPSKNRRLASGNITTIAAESINVIATPKTERDDEGTYNWTEYTTQYKYVLNGKEAFGTMVDENMPVGSKFTLYQTADGTTWEHPAALLEDYEKGYKFAIWSLLAPGAFMTLMAYLGIPVLQRHQQDTNRLEALQEPPSRGGRPAYAFKV